MTNQEALEAIRLVCPDCRILITPQVYSAPGSDPVEIWGISVHVDSKVVAQSYDKPSLADAVAGVLVGAELAVA